MNKSQFVEELAAKCSLTLTAAEVILTNFFEMVYEQVANDKTVNFSGFGQFSRLHRKARVGINPRPPYKSITLPEMYTVKFKAGEAFKRAIKK